jgi:hypothetical protein
MQSAKIDIRQGTILKVIVPVKPLRPMKQQPSMIRVNDFWVHQGDVPGGFDWNRHIDEERELRARQASGA